MDNVFNSFSIIFNCIFCLLALTIFVGIFIRTFRGRFSKTIESPAVVVNMQRYEKEIYDHSKGVPRTKTECVVTFLCSNKRISFEVSEYSYDSFELNQEGVLKYKGSRFLDFQTQN